MVKIIAGNAPSNSGIPILIRVLRPWLSKIDQWTIQGIKAIFSQIIPGKRTAYDREGLLWKKLVEFVQKEKIPCSYPSSAIYHDHDY